MIPDSYVDMSLMKWVTTVFALFICLLPIWVAGLKVGLLSAYRGMAFRYVSCWLTDVAVVSSVYFAHMFILTKPWAVLLAPAFALALGMQIGQAVAEMSRFNKRQAAGLSYGSLLLTWAICLVLVCADCETLSAGAVVDPRPLLQSIATTLILLLDTVVAVLLLKSIKRSAAASDAVQAPQAF